MDCFAEPVIGRASAIVKWQPLYSAANNGRHVARVRRICGTLPTPARFSVSPFINGKDASLRRSNGGR